MAWRGHELNLIMRVQDRATTRIRRIANDLGNMERASELQRKGARLAAAHNRNAVAQARTVEQLQARTSATGEKVLGNQAKLLRLRAQELTLSDRLSRMKPGVQQQATALRLRAVQKDMLRIRELENLELAKLNAQQIEQLAIQRGISAEMLANEAALQRAIVRERQVTRARTAIHAGGVGMIAGGIGLVSAGAMSGQFAEFNRQAVGASTQMRGVNESFASTIRISKTLQAGLLDLTRQFPASATEMADAIYDIASGMDFQIDRTSKLTETQQRFNQSFRLLKIANKVAIAGNLDLATATDVVITSLNNFDPSLKNVTGTMDSLFATVRFGKGTFADFAPQIGRLASAANAAGQPLNEAGGALAFLSQRLPLAQATTALVRIFQIIGRKEFTTGFEELFKVSPFEKGTRQLRDFSELMFIIEKQGPKIWKGFKSGSVDLMNVLQNITAAGQNTMRGTSDAVGLQSTEFARRAITNFIVFGDNYRSTLEDVTSTQKEFFRSFQAFREQPGVQWQIAINQFKAFGIVIGQTVLPVILRLIDWVAKLVHRFEDLDPRTRNIIGQFAAWGSAILFVGGAVSIFIGGIALMIAKLGGLGRILGIGAGGAGLVARFTMLWTVMRRMSTLGAIVITLKAIWSGDPSAKDFILGALMGAAAGARFGPLGALAGGIVVPVTMAAATSKGIKFNKAVDEAATSNDPIVRAYAEYFKNAVKVAFRTGVRPMSQAEFRASVKKFKVPHAVDAVERNRENLHNMDQDSKTAAESILERWQRLASELTGLDIFAGMSKQAAQSTAMIELNLQKAMAAGSDAKIRAALQASIKFDKAEIAKLEKLPKTAERVNQLIQLYGDLAQKQEQLRSMDKASTKEVERKNKALERQQKAMERANRAMETAQRRVQTLKLKMQQLREEAVDKLRTAFGSVFGGPLMQGPIGGMFQQISSMLSGVGQQFAIPADFILKDQAAQQKQFDLLISDLDFLSKRGVGPKVIQDILSQGTAALPMLEGIRKGSAGQQKQFIDNLKNANSAIAQAMQSPWQKQITASNVQLRAAQLQLQAAQKRVAETKGAAKKVSKPTGAGGQTRTPQSVVHQGDTVTINADGATPRAVQAALNRHSFDKRNRR